MYKYYTEKQIVQLVNPYSVSLNHGIKLALYGLSYGQIQHSCILLENRKIKTMHYTLCRLYLRLVVRVSKGYS